jgi:carbon monoxide dehydrogenase subunit G
LVRIDYEFTVGVPVDQAWGRLLDLGKIAPCLPGAAIQEQTGGNEYAGTIRVEIGPITVGYKGTVMFEEIDVADHRAVLHATGRETRGQGTATATIVSTLHDEGEVTMVTVETDLRLTGRAAQFGRGLAQDVAKGMLDEFAVCLEREISGENAGQPAAAEEISTGAAASVDASPVQQPKIQTIPTREPREIPRASEPHPVDRDATLERLSPALAVAGVMLVLIWLFRRAR